MNDSIKVCNAMLSKGMGGIEQAFLDYSQMLRLRGMSVVSIVRSGSKVAKGAESPCYEVHNFCKFDPFTILNLKRILKKESPHLIITHGTRAASLFQKAAGEIPVISLCHNHSYRALLKSNFIIAVSEHLRDEVICGGYDANNIVTIPNMVTVEPHLQFTAPQLRPVPVIGAIGRFVKKKGFDLFIRALSILKARKIKFSAVLGGDGEECDELKRLADTLNLSNELRFIGWVADKQSFYDGIDIFCLPSIDEPFGIVILEAFKHSKAVIATRSGGPSHIIQSDYNGILCAAGNASELADRIQSLIASPQLVYDIAQHGFQTVMERYSQDIVSQRLQEVVANQVHTNCK